ESYAILIEGTSGRNGHLAKRAIVIIAIKQAGSAVTSNVDIRPAIIIEICGSGSHPIGTRGPPIPADKNHRGRSAGLSDARSSRDIGKGSVPAVAIQNIGAAGVTQRSAGDRNIVVAAIDGLAGLWRPRRIEVYVIGDKQIELSVAVIIQKTASCAPPVFRSRYAGLFGNICEGSIPIIVIKNVSAEIRHEQIVKTIVVVVSDAARLSPAGTRQTSLLGYVGEGAVPIVAKQVTGRLTVTHGRIEAAAVH